jgi:hypothetical protein
MTFHGGPIGWQEPQADPPDAMTQTFEDPDQSQDPAEDEQPAK